MTPPQPVNVGLEELMDMLAFILATDSRTENIDWILGDVGMGDPNAVPFGYISNFNESARWESSRGGQGGLPAPGQTGMDDWDIPIAITVVFDRHAYAPPITANPPITSPLTAAALGLPKLPWQEQPGWRRALRVNQIVKSVLRSGNNPVIGGEAATTRIIESRYLLQVVRGDVFRAARTTLQAQQRRQRGA